jgi:hypothetical protein
MRHHLVHSGQIYYEIPHFPLLTINNIFEALSRIVLLSLDTVHLMVIDLR